MTTTKATDLAAAQTAADARALDLADGILGRRAARARLAAAHDAYTVAQAVYAEARAALLALAKDGDQRTPRRDADGRFIRREGVELTVWDDAYTRYDETQRADTAAAAQVGRAFRELSEFRPADALRAVADAEAAISDELAAYRASAATLIEHATAIRELARIAGIRVQSLPLLDAAGIDSLTAAVQRSFRTRDAEHADAEARVARRFGYVNG